MDLVHSIFGDAIDCTDVRIKRRKWFPFQPARTVMAPCGHIHFHPNAKSYRDDFSQASIGHQGLFIHEMTHVWQTQVRGRWYLPLMRHPWCRYDYILREGWALDRYGIEQQAEIMRHIFLLKIGAELPSNLEPDLYKGITPFPDF